VHRHAGSGPAGLCRLGPRRKGTAMDRNAIRRALTQQLEEDKGERVENMDDTVVLREGLGLDSIDVVTLVINIQSRFGIELKSEELEKIVTVGDLLDLLQVKLAQTRAAA
jgi:acyl carrier protein